MTYRLTLGLALIGIGLCLGCSPAFSEATTTVYFIPFDVETYIPVTQADIASRAWEQWNISSHVETTRLITILNRGPKQTFDSSKVRCLIVVSSIQTYLIDANGVVSQANNLGTTLDKAEFEQFRDSLKAGERVIFHK